MSETREVYYGGTHLKNVVQRARVHLTNVLRVPDTEADILIGELIAEIESLNKEIDALMISQCKCPD